jgi:hypothetical protein
MDFSNTADTNFPAVPNASFENNQGDEPINIFAHIAPDEIPYLNEMQGEEIIDPETGLRDYTILSSILQFPETQEALGSIPELQNMKQMAEGGHAIGRPIVPELEELRKEGRRGDTELIIITPELAEIFDEWSGGKSTTNPITGFPEYGFFKEIFRIAAPIVGAVLGGPIGAFAGSAAANKLTGKSWGDSLKQGAFSAGLTLAAPMIGGAFSSAFPGAAGTLGGATKGIFGSTIGGAVNNLFTPAAQGAGILANLGFGGGQQATQAGIAGGKSVTASAAPSMGNNLLSSLGSNILPLAATGMMLYKGHQQEQKALMDYEAKQRAEMDRLRNESGFNTPWRKPKPYQMELLPGEISPEDLASGRQRQYFKHAPLDKIDYEMASGGPIRGNGKGQQDNIPQNIKEGSYIIDASTVSDIGDGSTQGGFKELNSFFSHLSSSPIHEKKGGLIKALVSDGEYEVSPEKVTALGNGSNQRGAKILENMISQIREGKRTSGNKLPPKSKPINSYLRNLSVA